MHLRRLAIPILLALVAVTGCTETDDLSSFGFLRGGGGGSTLLSASFVPTEPSPGALTVSAAEDGATGPLVTVAIDVTGVSDVFGAGFDLTFDPDLMAYVSWAPGELLEQGGNQPTYQLSHPTPGRIVVGASRTGGAGGADAPGTRTLIRFTFEALAAGNSALALASADLLDDQAPPQAIASLSWFGGSLAAQ